MIAKISPEGLPACVDGVPGKCEALLHSFSGETLVPVRREVVFNVLPFDIPAGSFAVLQRVSRRWVALPCGMPLGAIAIVPGNQDASDGEPATAVEAD